MASRMAGATPAVLSLAKFIGDNVTRICAVRLRASVSHDPLETRNVAKIGAKVVETPLFSPRFRAWRLYWRSEFAIFCIGQHCCPNLIQSVRPDRRAETRGISRRWARARRTAARKQPSGRQAAQR